MNGVWRILVDSWYNEVLSGGDVGWNVAREGLLSLCGNILMGYCRPRLPWLG